MFCCPAPPEVSEIQLAETQRDSGNSRRLSFCIAYLKLTCLQEATIDDISIFQMSSAWQSEHPISIQTSSLSAGSARVVSSAPWRPRHRPPLGPIRRDSFQPTASVNFPALNWRKEQLKCGLASTTLPWSSPSPGRPEVRMRDEEGMGEMLKNQRLFFYFDPKQDSSGGRACLKLSAPPFPKIKL